MSKERKESWLILKIAMADFDAGIISRADMMAAHYRFYADAEPLIENLGELEWERII